MESSLSLGAMSQVAHVFGGRRIYNGSIHEYEELDFSLNKDQETRNLMWRKLQSELMGTEVVRPLFLGHQVHGVEVFQVKKDTLELDRKGVRPRCDALITNVPGVFLGVITADCLPVLMASTSGSVVAAVHAGWRGLVGGILEHAIAKFWLEYGISSKDLVVEIGPHIGSCCFEIGGDVVEQLAPESIIREGSQVFGNLKVEALSRLRKSGISKSCISTVMGCTYCDGDSYFSYRRQGTEAGRQLSVIGCCV